MRFIIATRSKDTADEIRWAGRGIPGLEVFLGSFESLPSFDCVATAGNSFGLMDAGMDLPVLKFFGVHIQERIQKKILEDFCGASNQSALRLLLILDDWITLMLPTRLPCASP